MYHPHQGWPGSSKKIILPFFHYPIFGTSISINPPVLTPPWTFFEEDDLATHKIPIPWYSSGNPIFPTNLHKKVPIMTMKLQSANYDNEVTNFSRNNIISKVTHMVQDAYSLYKKPHGRNKPSYWRPFKSYLLGILLIHFVTFMPKFIQMSCKLCALFSLTAEIWSSF